MDKYEYNLKLDQMKSLYAEEKYEDAADIADTINWNKIKNVNALVKAGEIYEKTERYEDSREVLLLAYDRSPIGRMIIYRLAEVAIKMGDYEGAEDYYQEFVEIAPRDSLKYVLRYDIKKAEGASYEELIPILEELKEQEYTEEWAYELAYLYHKAGMSDKCIEACDELILWFGDGPYVERALELKMLYQPLTKAQEDKYRTFRKEKESRDGLTHIDVEEMKNAGEYEHEPVVIPPVKVNSERFNTVNLQQEIAKGMQQIMEATEKETVTDTMDNINKIVEEIPYLKLPKEEEKQEQSDEHIETDEEIDGSLKMNFKEMLGEDSDGQMSMVMDDKTLVEHQITGQITIEEVLSEWEKTRRAAEAALEEAKQRKLESAKARALQQAGDIMDRLTGVIPKLDAGVTPRELLEEEYLQDQPETKTSEVQTAETVTEPVAEEDVEEVSETDISIEEIQEEVSETDIPTEEMLEEVFTEDMVNDEDAETEGDTIEQNEVPAEENVMPEEQLESEAESKQDMRNFDEEDIDEAEEEQLIVKRKNQIERSFWKGKTTKLPEISEPENLGKQGTVQPETPLMTLTEKEKTIFSYFMPVKGMEAQLRQALTGATRHLEQDKTASTGNLLILGGHGTGKTTLATSIIKVLQQETGRIEGKVGKIQAETLNKKTVGEIIRQVEGGCLIIENAEELTRDSVVTLSLLLEQESSGLFVILEGTSKGIRKLMASDEGFARKFTESISVPIFTNDELVTFARSYSRELGYKIDDMAVLALYNRISNIQRLDQATTLTEVKDIVDEAIDREAHGGIKKAISILTASRYTDDDRIVLREKDFE
uniref:tetratricopeptide repeat protein n=1 Tax=Agathobacter sp. TaxID=2021311 RepID=UPI003FF06F0E